MSREIYDIENEIDDIKGIAIKIAHIAMQMEGSLTNDRQMKSEYQKKILKNKPEIIKLLKKITTDLEIIKTDIELSVHKALR